MLILIGLFFLYIDIYMSSIDIVADAVGFVLLAAAFLLYWRKKQCSFLWALWTMLAAVCAAFPWFGIDSWLWTVLSWLFACISSFFLVWRLYLLACDKACQAFRQPPGPEFVLHSQHLTRLLLLFILLCELCSPILGLVPALSYILLIARTISGIFVMIRMHKMLYWNAYC